MRIVVVDDHIFMRDSSPARLNRQETRYSVVASVGTGAEAIEACKKFSPDLMILDINLPDQNGIDIVPTIKRVSSRNQCAFVHRVPDGRSARSTRSAPARRVSWKRQIRGTISSARSSGSVKANNISLPKAAG